ncbi:MAG: helix-turn-helix transcriptional regulator [Oscillospiraceae bacterium]|nr:helix-turn-helix transcriptional regulator [Oscillospiraceae bacterium]
MHYYQRLKDLREDADMNQEQAGKALGITRQQYQLYESGKREIPFHCAVKLADFYGVSLDYIAGRTNNKKGLNRSELPEKETELINKFRSLSDERKGKISERMDVLCEEQSSEEKTSAVKGAG